MTMICVRAVPLVWGTSSEATGDCPGSQLSLVGARPGGKAGAIS